VNPCVQNEGFGGDPPFTNTTPRNFGYVSSRLGIEMCGMSLIR